MSSSEAGGKGNEGEAGAGGGGGGPMTPAFLLQLIKLLKRKEGLLEQAHAHNDAMSALRERGDGTPEEAEKLQKDFAWSAVQIDRANFQLRNALWGVALGMHTGATGSSEASNSNGAGGSIGVHSGLVAGEDGQIPVVKQCEEVASVLLRAVAGNSEGTDADRDVVVGTEAVQPLVGSCLSCLMLLRLYEEQTALAACTGKGMSEETARQWDRAFATVLESLRPKEGNGGSDAVYRDIVGCVETLKHSIAS